MCSPNYVPDYDTLEIATGDAVVIKENIIAVVCEVLKNSQRPRNIGAAITDKNGFLDPFHIEGQARTIPQCLLTLCKTDGRQSPMLLASAILMGRSFLSHVGDGIKLISRDGINTSLLRRNDSDALIFVAD